MTGETMGVHAFRAAVSEILERFRDDPNAEPVGVGPYRHAEAVLLPRKRYEALVRAEHVVQDAQDHPDLPAISAQLQRSPEQRLTGLTRAAAFFASATRVGQ